MEASRIVSLLVLVFVGFSYGIPTVFDDCAHCQDMVSTVNNMFGEREKRIMASLCNKMSRSKSDLCTDLGELCPAKVCQKLDRCAAESLKYEPLPELDASSELDITDSSLEHGLPCILCQNFMKIAHSYLSDKRHQRFILGVLKSACRFVPFLTKECEDLVDHYGALVLRLAAHYINPETCKMFHICPAGQAAIQQDECKLCKFSVGIIYDTVQDPALETRLEEFAREMCAEYVDDEEECKSIAEDLTQYILPVAEELRESDYFKHACERANICTPEEMIFID